MTLLSPRSHRSLFIFLVVLILTSLAPQFAHGQSVPPTHTAPPPPPPPPAVDQQQFISYWTTETGWSTELQLRNNQVGRILTVTPVLRTADGTETSLFPVLIQPQEVKTVDLATAVIASSAPQLIGTYGSVALRYSAPSQINLYAVSMVMGVGHSIAFHIDATGEDQTEIAGSREGIWWLPSSTSNDYLVLANQGQNPLQLALSIYDASGKASTQNITLPPRGMNRVSARQIVSAAKLAGSYGGIKVSALTNAGFLDTLHVLFDQDPGFSAVMKMFFYDPRSQLSERDYAATGQWTLRAPMLALSSPDPSLAFPVGTVLQPQLFVRNTTSKPIDASLSFNWRTDTTTGKAAGPVLHLVPFETRRIDVAALQDGKTLPQNAQWTSVIMSTSGLPEEVMAVAASYDQSLHYGAQTPFSDQLAVQWEGGQWQYDPQHDSIITAGNGSSKPTQVAFTIFYNQGTQKYELDQTLQPGDQIWMDIGKLIRESVPDKNGNTLPANLTSGSYDVRDLSGTRVGTLFEGKVIYDKTYGHVTYGCAACCGWGIPYPWFNPLPVPISVHVGNGMWASYPCGNYIDDVSYNFYNNWTTGNTAIATYDSTGTALGVAPGSTSSQTHGNVCSNDAHNGCPLTYRASSGTVNVCVVPTNFHQTSTTDNGNGDIHFTYAWSSSTGNPADLSSCHVLETVTYPGSGNYSWPAPFPAITSTNPTILTVPGADGGAQDDNGLFNADGTVNTNFRTPYSSNSFTAQQTFSYSCTCGAGTIKSGTLLGPLSIVRQVSQNTNGTWNFTATKPTNGSATINPLP